MRASPLALRHLALCRRHLSRWTASRRPSYSAAASQDSVYESPEVYDAAFGLRNFDGETQFLVDACRRHGPCPAPRTWLELACGPGRHTRLAAFDHGLRAVGLDVSPAMVAYAQQEAQRDCEEQELKTGSEDRVQPLFAHGDMCGAYTHAAVAASGPYDIICLLLGSLSHLTHLDQAAQCFASAKALLSASGTFIVEMNHPRHLFDGSITQAARRGKHDESQSWEVPGWTAHAPDGRRMDVLWGAPDDAWDAVTQTLQRTVQVHVHPGSGAAAEPATHLRCLVPSRLYTAGELHLLASRAGLRVVATYGDLDPVGVDVEDPHAERLVAVLCHAV